MSHSHDLITIFVTATARPNRCRASIAPGSIRPPASIVWVDLAAPSIPESLILSDTFASIRCRSRTRCRRVQYPEGRGLRRLPLRDPPRHRLSRRTSTAFGTHDVDFFVGPNYLVTVHDGDSRSIDELRDHATRNAKIMSRGPGRAASPHRRRHGRSLPSGDGQARGPARRAREGDFRQAGPAADPADPRREAPGRRACGASSRRSATSSPAWRGAISSTSAPRCRSGSATSTITSSASPTMR